MFRYLLKFTVRGFARNRVFFLINILGLSLSLAAFVTIHNYVAYEYSYDRHHDDHEQLYRVTRHYEGETPATYANCFAAVGPHAEATIPEVIGFGRVIISDKIMSHFSLAFEEEGRQTIAFNHESAFFADQGIADFFIREWLEGNPEEVLTEPNQIVISRSVAEKYFGGQPALGKYLRLNGQSRYMISGVFADQPSNTHLNIQVLCSMSSLPDRWNLNNEWGWGNFHTYIRSASLEGLSQKIHDMAAQHLAPEEGLPERFLLQPVTDIHLHSDLLHEVAANGSASTMRFLEIIGWMILAIGLINYVNLYTARALEATQSTLLKKIVGSSRQKILAQLLFETLFMGVLASAIAVTASQLAVPMIRNLFGLHSLVEPLAQLRHILIFIGGLLLITFYPIYTIARVPVRRLVQRDWRIIGGLSLRRVLVVFQFALTTLLIIATIVVADQKEFMLGYETGFKKEQVLVVTTPATVRDNFQVELNRLKGALSNEAAVTEVGLAAHLPGYEVTRMRWIHLQGHNSDEGAYPKVIAADAGYFRCLDFELRAGRFFDERFNDERTLIINEVTMRELGFQTADDAVARKVILEGETYEIVGVLANYHQRSLRSGFQPIMFVQNPSLYQHFTIALQDADLHSKVTQIEGVYRDLYPSDPFDYFFLDTYFDQQYARDIVFGQVTSTFSMLAIVIALFGLAGLTLFSVNQRIKEIGIRKVLGAGWRELIWLFNASFLRLIAASFAVSVPLAYWLMTHWLDDYAYRIELAVGHFAVPLLMVLLIASCIIAAIVSRFIRINPVETLRSE